MDIKERIEAIDDFIKVLSGVMGKLSAFSGEKMTTEEKESFVRILLDSRRLLLEKYKSK